MASLLFNSSNSSLIILNLSIILIFNYMYNLCLIFNIDNYLFFKLYINIIGLNYENLKNF